MTIPETMRAVICYGPGDYRMETRPVPRPKPGEVLVKVLATGVCAGDVKCFAGAPMFWGDESRPAYCESDVIPGHEFVGEVVELGEGAGEKYELSVGDHAVSEQIVPCGKCRFCQSGDYWMCQPHDIYGFHRETQGAWAEYMVYPAKALNYKLPETLSPRHGVFVEPLACSIHAVNRGNIGLNDVVVISGCGALGLGMVAAARLKNPAKLVALDLNPHRLELAKKCGADIVLNPAETDVVGAIRDMTEGYGCDVYIEATGAGKSVEQGLLAIRKLGTFVEFSVFRDLVTVDWTIIGDSKELDIHGAHLSPRTYPTAIRMLEQGLLPIDEILTHFLPLEDFRKGIDIAADGSQSLKVVLEPGRMA
ncbi:alcohol dehydrogenase catalytic domain-containing protein [Martelella radicis]|uniref:Threonine dehydrogenase-like Zn-dependent dehydrogenase n=1 Tax=Martelella radicis TaxID=1397476 RepID=A0A7W6KJD2_9HYPH|nr:alcohol dehydrogenase catalytic domain-containing protein [Martelella radicis]MBB4120965.1 threonine dehydrogenase-like Zn-dependent dehydrogenase [Martelella radicis]